MRLASFDKSREVLRQHPALVSLDHTIDIWLGLLSVRGPAYAFVYDINAERSLLILAP